MVVVLESARRSLSSCSNQLVARAWLGTIDVLRSLETLREFSHTSLPAFSVDLGVQNFGISKKGGLPRTLCNVQAVVNASAKGSASSDPRGAKGSASSDPPCSPCACAPWMTRKHSKRAHTNSRRSRSRHEEITGLQVMLGRMFALKVQCDLPEGLAVVLRRCPWTSGRRRRQQRCGVPLFGCDADVMPFIGVVTIYGNHRVVRWGPGAVEGIVIAGGNKRVVGQVRTQLAHLLRP